MKLAGLLILLLGFSACAGRESRQILLRKNNPMPNEVSYGGVFGNPSKSFVTPVSGGDFRDAAIHIGSEHSIVMNSSGLKGVDALSITQVSALPHKDMLNTNLEDWDLSGHELVEVIGESQGCQTGVTLYIPVKQGNNNSVIPVNFKFANKTFYEELRENMEKNKILALFDSRLDKERESYVFGIVRRECTRFRGIGIKKKT